MYILMYKAELKKKRVSKMKFAVFAIPRENHCSTSDIELQIQSKLVYRITAQRCWLIENI